MNRNGYYPTNTNYNESDISPKSQYLGNNDERRQEMQLIRGMKCLKCGYSSVKVPNFQILKL